MALLPVAAVHGLGGALTHGHPHSAASPSAVASHAYAGSDRGVHSLTVSSGHGVGASRADHAGHGTPAAPHRHQHSAPPRADPGLRSGSGCVRAESAEDAGAHSHADCMGVAPAVGAVAMVLWPAFLPAGPRVPAASAPQAIAVHGRRRRRRRLRRTRLRLAELSVLRI
ncbi:hypothetical protein [Streptomonospora wellingtoniae]|uniref:Uncharacterized protein n=1 Tax=Streptomonospora wellingtoniae TaxID=3075544 RepID=A0ABU2L0X1_9ACTN|nr:hypothetical protein [Streptomonospora sp. DSM 45055]MDT0305193.1 hypothetical protein [Streptomonospora sp. DSM 45055]